MLIVICGYSLSAHITACTVSPVFFKLELSPRGHWINLKGHEMFNGVGKKQFCDVYQPFYVVFVFSVEIGYFSKNFGAS